MEQTPSQGRIVRYVEIDHARTKPDGEEVLATWAAVVVLVHPDGRVGLNVFRPYGLNEWQEAVPYSETPADKTWSWFPRQ